MMIENGEIVRKENANKISVGGGWCCLSDEAYV
jgi:hypothetical protein